MKIITYKLYETRNSKTCSRLEQITFKWHDDFVFVLDQHTLMYNFIVLSHFCNSLHWCKLHIFLYQEKLKDTKGVIRSNKSKDRQHNVQKIPKE